MTFPTSPHFSGSTAIPAVTAWLERKTPYETEAGAFDPITIGNSSRTSQATGMTAHERSIVAAGVNIYCGIRKSKLLRTLAGFAWFLPTTSLGSPIAVTARVWRVTSAVSVGKG